MTIFVLLTGTVQLFNHKMLIKMCSCSLYLLVRTSNSSLRNHALVNLVSHAIPQRAYVLN